MLKTCTSYSIPTLQEIENILGDMDESKLKKGIINHSTNTDDVIFDIIQH